MDNYIDEMDMANEATKLQNEFNLAEQEKEMWNEKFDWEEQAYLGDREFGNIRTDSSRESARTTAKTIYMLIESQIDTTIPDPIFKPVCKDDEQAIKELQAEVDYTVRCSDLPRQNTITEREVKKHGITIRKVIWNKDYKGAGFKGRPEIISIHPKNILFAAGTIDADKAEAVYHVENYSLRECIRRYGEIANKLPGLGEQVDRIYEEVGKDKADTSLDVNKTLDVHNVPDNYSRSSDDPMSKYKIIEKWYKDEDDDVGMTAFSGKLILENIPKFYYRRQYKAVYNDDGITAEQEFDGNGNEILLEKEKMDKKYTKNDKTIEKGDTAPYYIPKTIPIIVQNNVPRSKCPWGISDVEIDYDANEALKKAMYKYEERLLKSSTKIFYNKNQEEESANIINNEEMQIVPVNDVKNILAVPLQYNDDTLIEWANWLVDMEQKQLGITQVWQGYNTSDAKSGKAIDSLVKQTAEKISIKVSEKYIAYSKIYRLVCDFILAFSEGDRPYRLETDIQPQYGTFNRYDMLKKDKSGNWVYPDWDIEISAESSFPKTKTFMFDSIIQLAQGGFLQPVPQNIIIWQFLEKTGFPNSKAILQALQDEVEKQAQMQMQQQQFENEQATSDMALKQQSQNMKIQQQGQKTEQNNKAKIFSETMKYLPADIKNLFKQLPEAEQMALIGGQNAE